MQLSYMSDNNGEKYSEKNDKVVCFELAVI